MSKRSREDPIANDRTDEKKQRNTMAQDIADIDTNLYSRQIGALGFDTMGKLVKLNVLISGLRGTGMEAAKNLVLAGPRSVYLHDDTLCESRDLCSNFYITEEDVAQRKTRAKACVGRLSELNIYVTVDVINGYLDHETLLKFDVVVFTGKKRSYLVEVNEFCRRNGIGFICCDVFGLAASVFVDFGNEFSCMDKDGEEPKSAIISGITHDEIGAVTVHSDKPLPFQDGDYVKFREVQGMVELNECPPMPIKLTGNDTFTIGDTTRFSPYSREGIATQVKMPVRYHFKSYKESCLHPVASGEYSLITPDLAKFGRPEQLHLIFQGILSYREKHDGALPPPRSPSASAEVLQEAQKLLSTENGTGDAPKLADNVDEEVCRNVSYFAQCEISAVSAFVGGVVAQEVVKHTGKYTPLRQWLYVDWFECLPGGTPQEAGEEYVGTGSRYEDQIIIFGKQTQKALSNVNLFLVGAGALGCEFLKNLALMGVACGGGVVTLTDMDNIEVSNLNRQFLFRREHVGKAKSVTAAQAARDINPAFNVKAIELRVGPDTEDTLDDAFWTNQDVILNALDNVQARQYVDLRCVWFNKPLLESGTLGTKANVQVIIPKLTQSYSDSQDPPEDSIPLCTLKHFPHAIEHTIEWSRDLFEGLFTDGPQEAQRFLKNSDAYFAKIDGEGTPATQRERLQKIKHFVMPIHGNVTLESCVARACMLFNDNFYVQISQLIHIFPPDHMTTDGRPFWSGPKRPPTPLKLDPNDKTHLEFVVAATNLFLSIAGLPECRDRAAIQSRAREVQLPAFVAKDVRIKVDEKDTTVEGAGDDEHVKLQLINELKAEMAKGVSVRVEPVEFEKDDDTNFHIDFICACANLRARNYNIEECSHHKCKMIAGKIIPAMATTTAMVTGLVSVELLKTLTRLSERKLEDFKNAFINLALPLWLFTEPLPPIKTVDKAYDPIAMGPVKARPHGFTTWDSFVVKTNNGTISDLLQAIEKEFSANVSILSIGNACIYNGFLPAHKKTRLHIPIAELYETITKQPLSPALTNLAVEASCADINDGSDVIIPRIKFVFK